MLKGFKDFVMRGNVVDLAVAVVIGAAFGAVVTSFVNDILMQFIALIGGQPDFSSLQAGPIKYGAFLNAVVSFLIIAAAIYFVVVIPTTKLMERRKRGEEPEAAATPEDVALLQEIRDLLRDRG